MKSEWKVLSNLLAGVMTYQVYRLKNVDAVDHSGNHENIGKLFKTEAEARALADEMNRMDGYEDGKGTAPEEGDQQ